MSSFTKMILAAPACASAIRIAYQGDEWSSEAPFEIAPRLTPWGLKAKYQNSALSDYLAKQMQTRKEQADDESAWSTEAETEAAPMDPFQLKKMYSDADTAELLERIRKHHGRTQPERSIMQADDDSDWSTEAESEAAPMDAFQLKKMYSDPDAAKQFALILKHQERTKQESSFLQADDASAWSSEAEIEMAPRLTPGQLKAKYEDALLSDYLFKHMQKRKEQAALDSSFIQAEDMSEWSTEADIEAAAPMDPMQLKEMYLDAQSHEQLALILKHEQATKDFLRTQAALRA